MEDGLLSKVEHFRHVQGELRGTFYAGLDFLASMLTNSLSQSAGEGAYLELIHDGYNLVF